MIRETVADPGLLFARALPVLFDYAGRNEVVVTGPPLGIYHGVEAGTFDMAVGLPVAAAPEDPDDPIHMGRLPGGRVVVTDHIGPYERVTETWIALTKAMTARGRSPRAECWEEYHLGPKSGRLPAEFVTTFVQPVE
jgi:effector-binding domain-containing protein